jgi:hypothetical protein
MAFGEFLGRIPLTAKFRPENIQYCFSGKKFKKLKSSIKKELI